VVTLKTLLIVPIFRQNCIYRLLGPVNVQVIGPEAFILQALKNSLLKRNDGHSALLASLYSIARVAVTIVVVRSMLQKCRGRR
jgi:hypothetical protein